MGIMDRIKNVAGGNGYEDDFVDQDGYYGNFNRGYNDDLPDDGMPMDAQSSSSIGQSNIGNMGNAGPIGGGGLSISGSALEMKVVKPQTFDSVSQIADHLLDRRTVVLNLENTSKETARRLIDFLSGVAYSINGSIKKIATNAYVITPNNVDVGDAQLRSRERETKPEPESNSDVFPEF